jgi:hypothetical protein
MDQPIRKSNLLGKSNTSATVQYQPELQQSTPLRTILMATNQMAQTQQLVPPTTPDMLMRLMQLMQQTPPTLLPIQHHQL